MAGDNKELKYVISGDASKFVAEAKKAKQAKDGLDGGSSSSNIKASNQALDAHGQKIAQLAQRYKTLEGARSFFDKMPEQLKKIDQGQLAVAKSGMAMAKSSQEYAKYAQMAEKIESRITSNNKGKGGPFSPHSNRQFGQIAGIGAVIGGQLLQKAGAVGRQFYQAGTSQYNQIASQYTINPALLDSQRAITQARFGLGQNLSGYQTFKNNVQASVLSSGAATPLALAGDLGGAAANAIGGGAQLIGALKAAGVGSNALGMIGKGAYLAAAPAAGAVVGLGLGSTLHGDKPEDVLEKTFNPEQLGHRSAQETLRDPGYQAAIARTSQPELKRMADNADKEVKLLQKMEDSSRSGDQKAFTKAGNDLQAFYNKTGQSQKYREMYDAGAFKDANMIQAAKVRVSDLSRAIGGKGTGQKSIIDEIKSSPEFQLQQKQTANQISDFQVDTARNVKLAKLSYSRQKEDTSKAEGRTIEDYNIQQSRFQLQGQYLQQDYSKTTSRTEADHLKEISRLTVDYNKNRQRSDEDYSRNVQANELQVFRVKRDYAIQAGRLDEDSARNRVRLEQDSTRSLTRLREDSDRDLSRLEEDSGRNLQRLTEDTNKSRQRSNEDYARNSLELSRQSSRSMADLNTSLKDSVLSIVAPGLTSNKGFQLAKLMRDYKKNKGRLQEDTQFQREGLDLSKKRSDEDIDRQESRGKEDINRELSRGKEDIGRNLNRGEEDIAREKSRGEEDLARDKARASLDALKGETDALKDSEINLRNINIDYARQVSDLVVNQQRALQDATTNYNRAMQDAATQYARATEQLNFDMGQSAKETNRALADMDVVLKRAGEDFTNQMDQINTDIFRFGRDLNLQLDAQANSYKDLVANGQELNKLFIDLRGSLGDLKQVSNKPPGDKVPGHALGLPEVPYDNYLARLHKGEMVLTAQGANQYRDYLGGNVNGIPGLTMGEGGLSSSQGGTRDIGGDPTNFLAKADNSRTFDLGQFGPMGTNWDASRRLASSRNNYQPPAGHQFTFQMPITIQALNGPQAQQIVQRRAADFQRGIKNDFAGLY